MSFKSDLVKKICGMISSLSHVFFLKKQHLFIFNITSETGTFSVVVRNESQLPWQATLKVGEIYTCLNLRRTKLFQGTEDETDVLVAVSKTEIVQGSPHSFTHFAEDRDSSKFISYEGTVTAADTSLQLYELDNSCQLVLSAIAVISSCPQLRCGDHVVVHEGHWDVAEKRLYACGRTQIQLRNRAPEPVVSSKRTAVHTFHRLTLPPSAISWYQQTASIVTAACDGRVPLDGEGGALHRLLSLENPPVTERSLTKEFICRPHRCIASQQFQAPSRLCPLADLVSAAASDSAPSDPSADRGWHHWVGLDSGRRTVAVLRREPAGGGLLLVSAGRDGSSCRVPLLLLPPPAAEPPSDCLVCVTEPRLVAERLGGGEPRVYLLSTEHQVTLLHEDIGADTGPVTAPPEVQYRGADTGPVPAPPELQDRGADTGQVPAPSELQDRGADTGPVPAPPAAAPRLLLHQRSSPRRVTTAGGAGAAGGVSMVLHGLLEEATRRRSVLLRLTGAAAGRAAHLSRGATYRLHSSEQHWTVRQQGCGQLPKDLRPLLADCAVLRVPDDIRFVADRSPTTQLQLSADALSVSELSPGGADDGLLTVRGVILERSHARDRYAKASHERTVSLDTHRVVLRLCDPVTADEVALYVCEPAQWVCLLGLVPGTALTAHGVLWAGGQTGAVAGTHLVTTALTELELTGWSPPPEHLGTRRPRLHLPVQFLSVALSSPAVSRWLSCATVADLRRVSLAAECSLCGHQVASGCCGFVGCHGRGRHVINARARAVLDDGSAAVTAQLIGDSVRQLLAVSDAEWRALVEEAEQRGEVYHLQSRTPGGRASGTAGLLSAVCQSDAIRRPIVCELKRFASDGPASAASAAGSGAVQTVFCEAVMEATAAVVTRLYPAAATTAPRDVHMASC